MPKRKPIAGVVKASPVPDSKCTWFTGAAEELAKDLYFPDYGNEETTTRINSLKITKHQFNHSIRRKWQVNKEMYDYGNLTKKSKEIDKLSEILKTRSNTKIAKQLAAKHVAVNLANEINAITKIIKTRRYNIPFSKSQAETVLKWMSECEKVYNECVTEYNEPAVEGVAKFNLQWDKSRKIIFKKLYPVGAKPAPFDCLGDEVRLFCSNVKSALSNLTAGHIDHFKMTEKKTLKGQSMFISQKAIGKNGIFKSYLGKIPNFSSIIDSANVKCDCRLVYDKLSKKFYLFVPQYCYKKSIANRQPFVALDPGEKVFMSYYGLNDYGKIAEDMRKPILHMEGKIRKYQRILSYKKNRKGNRLRRRFRIEAKIRACYDRIGFIVKEIHNQSALFLCRNYDTILLPKFETSKMVCDKVAAKKKILENITIMRTDNAPEIAAIKIKEYKKRRRLNGRVKFVLNMLSHYKFKQHLTNKCSEYGCNLLIVDESYTSQTCGKCGILSSSYTDRIKQCSCSDSRIDRDYNGARNILIKNHNLVLKQKVARPRARTLPRVNSSKERISKGETISNGLSRAVTV